MKSILNNSDCNEIINRINNLTPYSKGLWGKMTVDQMICHISDPIRDILGIRITEPVTPAEMRPQIIAMVMTESDWDQNLPTFPPYLQDEGGGGTKPTNFEDDKNVLIDLIKQLYNTKSNFNFLPHAGLGVMSRDQFGLFIWKHTDHHLREFGV